MPWFTASFVSHRRLEGIGAGTFRSREYSSLLTAADADTAYDISLGLAKRTVGELTSEGAGEWILDGISDLLIVAEPPEDGSELTWTQQELLPHELDDYIKTKEELSVFNAPARQRQASVWHVCKLVLVEVHDTGSHGDSRLVWTNTHLIKATDAELAYGSAVELGTKQAFESGTHRCDGDSAHWEFQGLRDLIETLGPPSDGGVLWFEEVNISSEQLRKLIPPRRNLGVFEWEARQHLSGA
jgi:hypothetical protein